MCGVTRSIYRLVKDWGDKFPCCGVMVVRLIAARSVCYMGMLHTLMVNHLVARLVEDYDA